MNYKKKSIRDVSFAGKKVLLRVDFNVPLDKTTHEITNDKRIVAALPTIKKLIADGGKVILCSHLGKPKNGPEEKFSLAPVAVRLSELLGQPVVFANDDTVVGENAKAAVAAMKDGDVVLLQNTRFRKEETKNVEEFSKELASLADCYVDDAFGSCHRAHCSTEGVTKFLSPCVAGYLIGKELAVMGKALENADRPFVAVLGSCSLSSCMAGCSISGCSGSGAVSSGAFVAFSALFTAARILSVSCAGNTSDPRAPMISSGPSSPAM